MIQIHRRNRARREPTDRLSERRRRDPVLQRHRDHHRGVGQQDIQKRSFFAGCQEQLARQPALRMAQDVPRHRATTEVQKIPVEWSFLEHQRLYARAGFSGVMSLALKP